MKPAEELNFRRVSKISFHIVYYDERASDTTSQNGKRKTLNGAKLVKGFSWCTQQDSNLWYFDWRTDFDLYVTHKKQIII